MVYAGTTCYPNVNWLADDSNHPELYRGWKDSPQDSLPLIFTYLKIQKGHYVEHYHQDALHPHLLRSPYQEASK